MSLIRKIKDYYKKEKRLLFTTPSHSLGDFIISDLQKLLGKDYFKSDFSEIGGFDNLRDPNGVIANLQEYLSRVYSSKKTFMLVNGSSSGIIASMLSLLKKDDKVLVARNCHVSVYNGLVLTGATPIWFLPQYNYDWGIYKGVCVTDIKKLINDNKDIRALIITSPTYEGIYSDITKISDICQKNDICLIVDEAHCALNNLYSSKHNTAVLEGAHISIPSLHKTCGAPNPCALLHISKKSSIPPEKLQKSLNLINTTSSSYPILAAIEATVSFLISNTGKKHLACLLSDLQSFKDNLPEEIEWFELNDETKLLLRIKGKNNLIIAELLNQKYNIEEEYSTKDFMLFLTGIGTTKAKLKMLNKALHKIVKNENIEDLSYANIEKYCLPSMVYTPQEAYHKNVSVIDTSMAENKICAELVTTYPPGIHVLFPGERINLSNIFKIDKAKIKIFND